MKKITFIIVLLFGVMAFAQSENYSIKNIDVNTEYSDFGVSYFGENSAIFASSKKVKGSRNKTWYLNKQPFLELYRGTVTENGELIDTELFSKKVNTKYHESNATFTKDLKTVYFSRDNYINNKTKKDDDGWILIQLFKAQVNEDGEWENIEMLPFNGDEFDTGHPTLNSKETKLYFTSNRPGGLGLTDIWGVDIHSDGTYGEPINLGPNVNTANKEMFPNIDENDVLYFSSNGYKDGFGGLDLYQTKIIGNQGVSLAKNMGTPLNSEKDDFGIVFQNGKRSGHFCSNRPGGKGDDDIYYFEELDTPKDGCIQYVEGVVREKSTGALLPGALVVLYDANGAKVESTIADRYATFGFKVDCNKGYNVTGTKENYDEDSEDFVTSTRADLELSIGLTLEASDFRVVNGKLMVNINPIYFDLDKSFIRKDAAIELEKVVKVMQKYPLIKIELGSHTDSRAPDAYNWALSNRRAKSSLEWIVGKGIDASRITGKGYGETELVNKCSNNAKCTEAEHELNRRTEFVIVNPEAVK
ncbi:MAG: OmpA family protein [Lutibacter sp.]|nr:OmpA family protein [Lutibacter sp.]